MWGSLQGCPGKVSEIRTSSPSGVKTVTLFLLIYWAILALVHRYYHCLNHGTTVRVAPAVPCVAGAAGGRPAGVPASPCTSWGKCGEDNHPPCPGKGFLPHQCKHHFLFYYKRKSPVKGKLLFSNVIGNQCFSNILLHNLHYNFIVILAKPYSWWQTVIESLQKTWMNFSSVRTYSFFELHFFFWCFQVLYLQFLLFSVPFCKKIK